MGVPRKDIDLDSAAAERCPKCGMHNLVHTRYIISITLDSIISGILTSMVVLWIGFFMGVPRNVAFIAALVASAPFVCVIVKRRCCRQCEIEFDDQKNPADSSDLEE